MEDILVRERSLLNVQRLSGKPKLRGYDLAQHSFFVTSMFIEFCNQEGVTVGSEGIELVMKHDIVEVLTGDLPYPAKNLSENTKKSWADIEYEVINHEDPNLDMYTDSNIEHQLTKDQYNIFKICDLMELAVFCKEEIELGNQNKKIKEVYYNCEQFLEGMVKPYPSIQQFYFNLFEET